LTFHSLVCILRGEKAQEGAYGRREIGDCPYYPPYYPWYEPNSKYTDPLLGELDRANLALIRKAEKQSEAWP